MLRSTDATRQFKRFFQPSTVKGVRKLLVPVCATSDTSVAIINSLAGFPSALVDGLSVHTNSSIVCWALAG